VGRRKEEGQGGRFGGTTREKWLEKLRRR